MMKRRTFLLKSAAAVAAGIGFPTIVPSTVFGKGGVAPSNRIVLAQIGCGGMGRSNLDGFLRKQGVQVVAVCDVDAQQARTAKLVVDRHNQNTDCCVYPEYRDMLAQESLDVISHALPDHWHSMVTVDCAKAGLDMYGEKPLARTLWEGRQMCNAVQRYGRVWQTGSWQRSVPNFHRGAELVRNGRIGKVTRVEVGLPNGYSGPAPRMLDVPSHLNWDRWLGPAPFRPYQDFTPDGKKEVHFHWRWILDYSGGQLTDWAGHHIDIAHWGLGLDYTGPQEITGKGVYPTAGIYNVPIAYKCSCRYANGVEMIVANAAQNPKGMGTVWYGDRGWIHVDRGEILRASDPNLLKEVISPNEVQLYRSTNHHQNFLDCVQSRQLTITPIEVAHRSISVALLCEIAMLTERTIRWNPETEEILGDPEATRLLRRPMRRPWHL